MMLVVFAKSSDDVTRVTYRRRKKHVSNMYLCLNQLKLDTCFY